MKKKTDHIGFRNDHLFCSNCGTSYNMNLPQPLSMVTAMTKQFTSDHKNCPKTWTEPSPQPKTGPEGIPYNVQWWIRNGEHGTSSKTMMKYMYGYDMTGGRESHPLDPDDFYRCHRLIQAVPQLKNYLHRMNPVSPVWENLVANWDKLTELLEEQIRTKKANGMYELMKSLGCR